MNFFKKRKTAWTLLAVTIVVCFFVGQAKSANKNETVQSGRIWVNDNANVLSASGEKHINEMVNGLYGQTPGAAIYVETVNSTYGQDPYDFCISIADKVGAKSNDCIFLIAVDDISEQIVPGKDLVYWFTDDDLSRLLYENMSESDFPHKLDQAIVDCFDDLIDMYEDYYNIDVNKSANIVTVKEGTSDSYFSGLQTMIICIFVVLLIWRLFTKPKGPKRPKRTYSSWGNYPSSGSYGTPDYDQRNSTFGGSFSNRSYRNSTGRSGSSSTSSFGGSSRGGSFGSSKSSSRSSSGTSSFRSSSSSSRGGSFRGSSGGSSFRSSSGSSRGGSFRGK